MQCVDQCRKLDRTAILDQAERFVGGIIPEPNILERRPLRFVYAQPFGFEKGVLVFIGIEGRAEINKIDEAVGKFRHNV